MTPHEDAWLRRILDAKTARREHVDQLAATHNRCAWCGEARVSPGQPFCVTHDRIGHTYWNDMETGPLT